MRKIIRKISLKKITYDLKENDVEKELTIYLSQYIMEMYAEYLNKKMNEKNLSFPQQSPPAENLEDTKSKSIEENKKENKRNLRTGDKYIIRKLVSMKIMPEQIQDFINMIITGTSNSLMNMNGFQMGYPSCTQNFNQLNYYDNNLMQVPQMNIQNRSNS